MGKRQPKTGSSIKLPECTSHKLMVGTECKNQPKAIWYQFTGIYQPTGDYTLREIEMLQVRLKNVLEQMLGWKYNVLLDFDIPLFYDRKQPRKFVSEITLLFKSPATYKESVEVTKPVVMEWLEETIKMEHPLFNFEEYRNKL